MGYGWVPDWHGRRFVFLCLIDGFGCIIFQMEGLLYIMAKLIV